MVLNKAYKFRIYPNEEQRVLFAKTFGCVRFVYNKMLGEKIAYYNACGGSLKVTPAKYKGEHGFLKEVDSLALANAQLNLEAAYRNFFRDKSIGFPKFKSKHKDKKSYTTYLVNGNMRFEGKYFVLPKLGRVRVKRHREIPDGYKLKSATISQSPSGKYHVSVLYEYEAEIEPVVARSVIGLDFSMAELYISSDGNKPEYPGYYRQAQKKLARMQRALSKMVKHSNNYYKQKHKIARLHDHVASQRKDFLHKQSWQITNANDCVAIEDLGMKAMARALNFGKSVSDNGWGMFSSFLGYKLREHGKQLIKVDKWFPSSKTCSRCGAVKRELALSDRVYICCCGNIIDRDVNAAINIRDEAMRIMALA